MIGGYASFGGTRTRGRGRTWRLEGHRRRAVAAGGPERQGPGGEPDSAVRPRDGCRRRTGCGSTAASWACPAATRQAEKAAWKKMQTPVGLQGANRLAVAGGNAVVLAVSEEMDPQTNRPYPLLVDAGLRQRPGAGLRRRHDEPLDSRPRQQAKHDRFWRQMILWLARQDEGDDQLRRRAGRAIDHGRRRPRFQPAPAQQERPGGQGRRLRARGGRPERRAEDGDADEGRRRGPRRLPAGDGGRVHDPRQGSRQGLGRQRRSRGGDRRGSSRTRKRWRWPSGRPTRIS